MNHIWVVEGDGARIQITCRVLEWKDAYTLIADGIEIKVDFLIFAIGTQN